MPAKWQALSLLAVCVAGTAVLGILLLPGESEFALMSFRDAEYDKARRYYEGRLADGDLSIPVLMPLIEIFRRSGETDRAVAMLERFVVRNPGDVEALTLLVRLCKDAVKPAKYQHYLGRLRAMAPTPERSSDLADLYGFSERYDEQIAELRQQFPGSENKEQRSRLITLLASTGQGAAAVDTAFPTDDGEPAEFDWDANYVLFRLLVDMRRPAEAFRLAERWVGENSKVSPAPVLCGEWFLYKGYPDLALRLVAENEDALSGPSANLRSVYVAALKATKQLPALVAFWQQRLAAPNLTEPEEVSILYGLLDLRDYARALPLLRKRATIKPGEWLFAYVETAVKAGRESDLNEFLQQEFARPGAAVADLQAVVSIVLQNSPRTIAGFLRVPAEKDPSAWAYLYAEALERLQRRGDGFAYIETILAGGKLNKTARDQWLHRLIDEAGWARALPHIRRVAESDGGAWRGIYVDALRRLQRRDELRQYLALASRDGRMQIPERRWVAEQMLQEGMKPEAQRAFMDLADGAAPDSPQVRSLLYLWGPRPQPSELTWIERQLANAGEAEKLGWMRLLLELGGADRALTWYESETASRAAASPELRALYVQALAARGRTTAVLREIAAATDEEKDPATLARYAHIASGARDLRGAERAWAAVLKIVPDDDTALRQRGLLLFALRRYADAQGNLRPYLDRHSVDYEAQYVYAEVLLNLERSDEAKQHYQKALSQIGLLPEKKYQARIIEAMCQHRLGEKDAAIAKFQTLLRDHPDDRKLQADFASILLENHSTGMARSVLQPR